MKKEEELALNGTLGRHVLCVVSMSCEATCRKKNPLMSISTWYVVNVSDV